MNLTVNVADLHRRIDNFAPDNHAVGRGLALYSAAIAVLDDSLLTTAARTAVTHGAQPIQLYEIVLQSYLFLGFPRMLTAAESLYHQYKIETDPTAAAAVSPDETARWYERGDQLCRQVYADNYERLRDRVTGIAPDIFRWMVFEGYGKVLSRPGVDIVDRELAIIACLMIENRPPQLFSHVRGALNVGADSRLVRTVIEDVGEAAGDGYSEAEKILERLKL